MYYTGRHLFQTELLTQNELKCTEVTDLEWGTVTIIKNNGVFQAEYKCISGYSLNGDLVRYCKTDGS